MFLFYFQLQISLKHFEENITWNGKGKKRHDRKAESSGMERGYRK